MAKIPTAVEPIKAWMLSKGIRIAALLALLAFAGPTASAWACSNDALEPSALDQASAREAVLCLINERRANQGLGALTGDPRLDGSAQGHSAAMNARNFFAHGNFQRRIARSGYLSGASSWAIGENLHWGSAGLGSPQGTVAAWMASRPHRGALLSDRFHDVGIGVSMGSPIRGKGGNSAVYTVDFGFRG
jgi:uncharacterized protein YkwD